MKTTFRRQPLLKVTLHQVTKSSTFLFADQLQELRKVSLASILCENLDEAYMVQPDVFIAADPYLNSPVTCDVFPRVNIELWKTDSPALQVIKRKLIIC